MPNETKESQFSIFFSWQSDLPRISTTQIIRESLRNVCNSLEERYRQDGLHITLDEATRDTAGSPNITHTIFEKIRIADVYICDLTTINQSRDETQRPVPNPNVAIELGYAIAHLDWSRIIILFNTAYGEFPKDLPFDIKGHRIFDYDYQVIDADNKATKEKSQQAKGPLKKGLHEAVDAIYIQNPQKTQLHRIETPEEKKRRRDIKNLSELMSTIHIPTMDIFFENIGYKISEIIFYFYHAFAYTILPSSFHLYDSKAMEITRGLAENWDKAISYDHLFRPSRNNRDHVIVDDYFNEQQSKDFEQMRDSANKAKTLFHDLLEHVRTNYIEIDTDITSQNAWNEYMKFDNEINKD